MAWHGETKQGNAWHRCVFGGWDPGVGQPVGKAVDDLTALCIPGCPFGWNKLACKSKTVPLLPLPTTTQKGEKLE